MFALSYIVHRIAERLAHSEAKKGHTPESALVEAGQWPQIPLKQFVMRFLAPYLESTSISGSYSEISVAYWCHFLDLWNIGEAILIPFEIEREILEELHAQLVDYGHSLDLTHNEDLGQNEIASKKLDSIKVSLDSQGYTYTDLGYREGPKNSGHAIPLRIEYDRTKEKIIVYVLNLGAGAGLNPRLEWDTNYNTYHFRGFPVYFEKEEFFGEKGKELFARLLTLQRVKPSASFAKYGTADIVGALATLGTVQGKFFSPLALRAKKPQSTPICADKAVELLLRDFLIEKGVAKKQIKRLLCNEKLCALLCFSHVVLQSSDKETFNLFRIAIKEFSTTVLKKSAGILNSSEVAFCNQAIELLLSKIGAQEESLPLLKIPALPLEQPLGPENLIFQAFNDYKVPSTSMGVQKNQQAHKIFSAPFFTKKLQAGGEFKKWLAEGGKSAKHLAQIEGKSKKSFIFLCEIADQLPSPLYGKGDYWDTIPQEDIPSVIHLFCELLHENIDYPNFFNRSADFRRRSILLHKVLAIADKLMRRIHPEMKGFSLPFAPLLGLTFTPQVPRLIVGRDSRDWLLISRYFESMLKENPTVIYAFHNEETIFDITVAFSHLKNESTKDDPVASHLQFLLQFFDNSGLNQRGSAEVYAQLWDNPDPKRPEFHDLHYLAYSCWKQFCFTPSKSTKLSKPSYSVVIPKGKTLLKQLWTAPPRGYDPDSITGFFSLLGEIEAKTENALFCERAEAGSQKNAPSVKARLELYRLGLYPSLKVYATIQWVSDNLSVLRHEEVQLIIEEKLFANDGPLIQQLQSNPHLAARAREMVQEGIQFYAEQPKDLMPLLFFIRLGIALETQIEAAFLCIDSKLLENYEALLLKKIGEEKASDENSYYLYLTLRFLYSVAPVRNPFSLKEMVKAGFWLKFSKIAEDQAINPTHNLTWLIQEIEYLEDKYCETLLKLSSKEKEWASSLCSEIFELLFPGTRPPEGEWQGSFPKYESKPYTLNLLTKTWQKNESETLWVFSNFLDRVARLPKEAQTILSQNRYLLWLGSEEISSVDKKLKLTTISRAASLSDEVVINKKYRLEGKSNWYYEIEPEDPLCESLSKNGFKIWLSPKRPDQYLVTTRKTDTPAALIRKIDQGFEVIKLDGAGNYLPYKLLNPLTKENNIFIRLGLKPHETLIWVDAAGEIAILEILPFDLQFQRDDSGQFISLAYPDFCLSPNQTIEALDQFDGALVLENRLGEKRVLIAPRHITRKDADFSTEIALDTGILYHIEDSNHPAYFCYQQESAGDQLISEEPKGNLYLALLYACQKNYLRALETLEKCRSFQLFDGFVSYFFQLKDRSPEALAFYLKVSLFLLQNQEQLIKERYSASKSYSISNNWMKDAIDYFKDYLRYATTKHSRIPSFLVLSVKEELTLIAAMEAYCSRLSNPLPSLLATRKLIIQSEKGVDVQLSPIKHRLLPKAFKVTPTVNLETILVHAYNHPDFRPAPTDFDPFFVRIDYLTAHFVELYNRARQGDGRLDVFYLLQSNTINELSQAYAALLYYVRKYPEDFAELNFGKDPRDKARLFPEIVAVAAKRQSEGIKLNLSTQVFFDYTSSSTLVLARPDQLKPLRWPFSKNLADKFVKLHLSLQTDFLEKWVQREKGAFIADKRPFIFDTLPGSIAKTPTLERLMALFQEGYRVCRDPAYGDDLFTWQEGADKEGCLKAQESLYHEKKAELIALKKEIEKQANTYPEEHFTLRLKRHAKALPHLTVEGVITEAVANENPNLLRAANPSLSPNDLEAILLMTIRYHILNCHLIQLAKGISALKKGGGAQEVGEALSVYGAFDPMENPELLIYQSRTKMICRKAQAEFIRWLQSTPLDQIVLFELAAGGGKGTFLTPILTKLARKRGLFPVTVSPASLYQVEREKQKMSLKTAYNVNLQVLELSLSTKAVAKDYQRIFETLSEMASKETLKIIPEVFYALDLKYKLALENGQVESVKYLSLILDLFQNRCAGFIDEGRLNASALTQAKIGIGKKVALPENDRILFLYIYLALTNPSYTLADGRKVSEVVQLQKNSQAMMSGKDLEAVRHFLIAYMTSHPFLNISEKRQKAVSQWWIDPKSPKPSWLNELNEQNRLITLAAEYFHNFYSFALKTVGQMRHVRSIVAEEELEVPAQRRKPSNAYFEEPYIGIIFTIHGTLQRGLDREQCARCIELLQAARDVEKLSTKTSDVDEMFSKWVEGAWRLCDISAKESAHVERFYQLLSRHREMIFWYLEKAVLKQVTFSEEHLTATPQDFLHGFKMCTVFSALLGPTELYNCFPPSEQKDRLIRRDTAFMAHVVHELTGPKNREMALFDEVDSPIQIFRQLWATRRDCFTRLRMVIDLGVLRDFSSEEIAASFFDFLKELKEEAPEFDGVVLFQNSVEKEEESQLMIQLQEWPQPVVLPEGEVVAGLARLGYKWEDLKLLTLIDPSHAVGSDILQGKEAVALVLIGENLPTGELVQGVLRLREFLKKQTILWGLLKQLASQMEEEYKLRCTPELILFWSLVHESRLEEEEIILSAYQQIDYFVQKPAQEALRKQLHHPENQIKIWKKCRKGFVRPFVNNPQLRFGASGMMKKCREVLLDHAKNEYEQYGYETSWSRAKSVQQDIERVIAATEAKIKILPSQKTQNPGRSCQIHSHENKQLKKEQQIVGHTDLQPEPPPLLSESRHIYQPEFLKLICSKQFATPAQELFNSKGFTSNLYLTQGLIKTAKSGGQSLGITYLKPAQFFLMVFEDKHIYAFALCDEEASFFHEQLLLGEKWLEQHQQKKSGSANRRVALFTADGHLSLNGPGSLGFTEKQMRKICVEVPWFKSVVTDLGLLSCRLRNLSDFVNRIQGWSDLPGVWERIKAAQPYQSPGTHPIDKCVATIEQKKSFFSFF